MLHGGEGAQGSVDRSFWRDPTEEFPKGVLGKLPSPARGHVFQEQIVGDGRSVFELLVFRKHMESLEITPAARGLPGYCATWVQGKKPCEPQHSVGSYRGVP